MDEIDRLKQETEELKAKIGELKDHLLYYAEFPDQPDCTSLGLPLDEDNDFDRYDEDADEG